MYCTGNTLDDDRDVYGREALTEHLYSGPLRRVLLVGLRRTGKTATLLQLERRALEAGDVVPLRIAPEGVETPEMLRNSFANALSRRRKLLPGLPGSFLKLRKLPLVELLQIAEAAAEEAEVGLLLLIDEVDAIHKVLASHPALAAQLRAGLPEGPTCRVIATGSRRALRMRFLGTDGAEPLLADFSVETLPPTLRREAAVDLIRLEKRGGEGAVDFTDAQCRWLLDRTGGHPYLTQAACKYAARFGAGPEQALDVVMASHEAVDAFGQDLERISPTERAVLQAIVGLQTIEPWQAPFRRALTDLGLLREDGGLSVAVLADFILRQGWSSYPARVSDEEVVPAGALDGASTPRPAAPRQLHFRPIRLLGEGSFGEVLLTEARSGEGVRRLVAIKLLRREWEGRAPVIERLRDEARMLALLRHRAIVRAEDLVRWEGRLGILMEYVPGVDLRDLLVQERRDLAPPPRALADITAEVAEALDVAYNRVVDGEPRPFRVLHRDIKPHNLRVTQDGDLKILDFGVASAQFLEDAGPTRVETGGTVLYMGPERHRGFHDHPGSDVFSLGVVLLELATGCAPEGPWPLSSAAFELSRAPLLEALRGCPSAGLLELVSAMTDRDPDRRPSAREVAASARSLSESLEGVGLRGWARRVVPELEALAAPAPTHEIPDSATITLPPSGGTPAAPAPADGERAGTWTLEMDGPTDSL